MAVKKIIVSVLTFKHFWERVCFQRVPKVIIEKCSETVNVKLSCDNEFYKLFMGGGGRINYTLQYYANSLLR